MAQTLQRITGLVSIHYPTERGEQVCFKSLSCIRNIHAHAHAHVDGLITLYMAYYASFVSSSWGGGVEETSFSLKHGGDE